MCEVCRCNPCDIRCPNAEDIVCYKCTVCGDNICVGEDYYDINDEYICTNCISDFKYTAQRF